jgi:tRNA U34 2-thiouridine synthase MnmA/TrmU
VIDKIPENNTLIVGPEDSIELLKEKCILRDWISQEEIFNMPLTCKIRYRQADIDLILSQNSDGTILAQFKESQRAVTPGQFLVAYSGGGVVGSGIIC